MTSMHNRHPSPVEVRPSPVPRLAVVCQTCVGGRVEVGDTPSARKGEEVESGVISVDAPEHDRRIVELRCGGRAKPLRDTENLCLRLDGWRVRVAMSSFGRPTSAGDAPTRRLRLVSSSMSCSKIRNGGHRGRRVAGLRARPSLQSTDDSGDGLGDTALASRAEEVQVTVVSIRHRWSSRR